METTPELARLFPAAVRTWLAERGCDDARWVPATGSLPPEDGKTPLQLPHERDEDTDMTDDQPDPKILQAYKDLKQGQVDTDMRATPGQDAAQRSAYVPGAGGQHPSQKKKGTR